MLLESKKLLRIEDIWLTSGEKWFVNSFSGQVIHMGDLIAGFGEILHWWASASCKTRPNTKEIALRNSWIVDWLCFLVFFPPFLENFYKLLVSLSLTIWTCMLWFAGYYVNLNGALFQCCVGKWLAK